MEREKDKQTGLLGAGQHHPARYGDRQPPKNARSRYIGKSLDRILKEEIGLEIDEKTGNSEAREELSFRSIIQNSPEEKSADRQKTRREEDATTQYVLEAFEEVCRKIDRIHSVIDRNYSLDTVIIEERKEEWKKEGWMERLKKILYGGEERPAFEEDTEHGSHEAAEKAAEESEAACASDRRAEVFAEREARNRSRGGSSILDRGVERGPQEIEEFLFKVRASACEVERVHAEIQSETRRMQTEFFLIKEQTEEYQRQIAEKTRTIEDLTKKIEKDKIKMKSRKKERSDLQESQSRVAELEKAIRKISSVLSFHVLKCAGGDKSEEAEGLYRELAGGNVQAILAGFFEAERAGADAIRKSEREKDAKIKGLEEKSAEISRKSAELAKEIEKKQEEAENIRRDWERKREEKDLVINKQRLAIKLLQSRIRAEEPVQTRGALPSPIVVELEQRIEQLQGVIEKTDKKGVQYRKYAEEIEDCRRRLADFLRI